MVHTASDGSLAVIGVFIEEGSHNPAFDRRCCMIPTTPKESASYVFGAKTQNQWNQ